MKNPAQNSKFTLLFSCLLFAQLSGILVYTWKAGSGEGWNVVKAFSQTLFSFSWQGQFAYDFSCYLLLSGLWIMWRHRFSALAICGGFAAMVLGILAFAPYLLILVGKSQGDVVWILTGKANPARPTRENEKMDR